MDKQLKPKNKRRKKLLIWGIPVICLVGIILMSLTRKRQVNLKKESINIHEVKKGEFEDVIIFNSRVVPKTSVFVNVIQGGSVSEIFVESGQMVKKGDSILKVYNPNAELNYLTQETAIVEQINNLRNIRVNIKSQQLNLEEQLLGIDNAFKKAKRQYVTDTTLYKKDIIARNDYEKSVQEYKFQKERNEVIRKSASEEKQGRKIQLFRIDESISNMQKSLGLLRKNKGNFLVKAPMDGLLSSFNPVLGENYNQGETIGKIDVLNGYKLVAKVDEYYITKVKENIPGNVVINTKTYNISIAKIYSEVVGGKFEIELLFKNDSVPKGIKQGMSLNSRIFLSNNSQALLIPKGQFYQSTNGKWVFVIVDNKGAKRKVKIGRENPFYYEVLDGLKEGDKVITSNYDDFKNVEIVNLK